MADYIPQSKELKEIDRMNQFYAVDEFGTSTNPMEHQTEALKARIFHGASKIEFAFFGHGKGTKEASTPESFGKRERQDMRELAEFNAVETSTHASVGVSGLSGFTQRGFDEHARKEAMDEVKRAINFAADASTGGAIVFHSGEAPRPLYSNYGRREGDTKFRLHPHEETEEHNYLVDPVTRQIVGEVKGNDFIAIPVYETDEDGNPIYIKDENGKPLVEDLLKPYDPEHHGQVPKYKVDADGNLVTELITFNDWRLRQEAEIREKQKRAPSRQDEEEIIKSFLQKQQMLQIQYNVGFGKSAEKRYITALEEREKYIKALNYYKKLKDEVPPDEWWKYRQTGRADLFVPPDIEDPVKYLKERLDDMDRELIYGKEVGLSGRRQAQETLSRVNRSQLIEKYAENMSARSIGELGVYAWQEFEAKKKDLKNPLYVAPENLFPESYGGHPDELKRLVTDGRKEMQQLLVKEYGVSEDEAKKLASKHIKATFDIGHANIWKKYMEPKAGESLEDRDKRFNKWLLGKTQELIKDGIIGHIHVSDNFGFHDEHLSAGDGNAPIKDFIKQAKDAGLSEFIVEAGSFNPMRALPDTWDVFHSPVYRISLPGITKNNWTDFYHSYFGKTEGPRYIVGDYAPSNEFKGEPFYTGISLE